MSALSRWLLWRGVGSARHVVDSGMPPHLAGTRYVGMLLPLFPVLQLDLSFCSLRWLPSSIPVPALVPAHPAAVAASTSVADSAFWCACCARCLRLSSSSRRTSETSTSGSACFSPSVSMPRPSRTCPGPWSSSPSTSRCVIQVVVVVVSVLYYCDVLLRCVRVGAHEYRQTHVQCTRTLDSTYPATERASPFLPPPRDLSCLSSASHG